MVRMPVVHYEIPDELHRRAKIAAINKGQTLKQFVIDALEQAATTAEAGDKRKRK